MENTKIRRKRNYILLFPFILSLIILSYPDVLSLHAYLKTRYSPYSAADPGDCDLPITAQDQHISNHQTNETASLQSALKSYNERLSETNQESFNSLDSAQTVPDVWIEKKDDLIGYIIIPAMNQTLPLYVGASEEHLAKGAAVLGETSMPVGGTGTNSVIAAHRGYRGIPFFRDIELLKPGDPVMVRNIWETLYYTVEAIRVIDPDDSDSVKIQKDRDLITLLTCHPYRSHGKYRYVVYCARTDPEYERDSTLRTEQDAKTDVPDMELQESSQQDIRMENRIRRISILAVIILFLVLI